MKLLLKRISIPFRSLPRYGSRCFSERNLKDMDWRQAHEPIESSFTPPSSWYTDKEFFEAVDKKQIFPNSWLLVGHTKDLQKDGDYIAGNILEHHPYLIVNSHGTLKAHYNVCRHHASQLVDEGKGSVTCAGNEAKRIRCPYHGWEYTLDGKLAKATHIKGCANFKPKDNSLIPILVDQLGPWVFVRLNAIGSSGTLRGDLPDTLLLEKLLHETQYEQLVHVETRLYHLRCNWKVFLDNYLDGGYHVPVAHPGLSQSLDMSSYTREGHTDLFVQTCASKSKSDTIPSPSTSSPTGRSSASSSSGSSDRVTAGARDALYLFLYPNLCINRYGDWLDTNIVWPTGVDTCTGE